MAHTHARLAALRKAEQATRDEIDQEVNRVLDERAANAARADTENKQPPGRNVTGGY